MVRGTISGKDQLLGIHALVIFWKICQVRNSNTYALNTFGKWLTKDFGLTAHSLRHTFRDRLRASGCPLELIDQLVVGHLLEPWDQSMVRDMTWMQLGSK